MKPFKLFKTCLFTVVLSLFSINAFANAAGYVDDASITAAVMAKLATAKNLPTTDIKVSTYQGLVQLSGFVDTSYQVKHAATVAKKVEGVKAVNNNLIVKTKPDNAATQYAKDVTITTKVKAKLATANKVSASQIGVNTYNGVVQLSGFVDKNVNIDKASDVAKSVNGVTKVVNNLIVKADSDR